MDGFRLRALALLADLDQAAEPYPDLSVALAEAREEVAADEGLARRGRGDESVDRANQSIDAERLQQ